MSTLLKYTVHEPLGFTIMGEPQWSVRKNFWGGSEVVAWVPSEDLAYQIADLLEEDDELASGA
jgi:hypothetical protein